MGVAPLIYKALNGYVMKAVYYANMQGMRESVAAADGRTVHIRGAVGDTMLFEMIICFAACL